MKPSSRTPEGEPNHCPVCGKDLRIEPSRPADDAPCPHCGHLLWFEDAGDSSSSSKRKRLHQCFEHACRQAAEENYDYAGQLFAQCVMGDPSDVTYIRNFLQILRRKYGDNKKGSTLAGLRGRATRDAMKKAARREEWENVIRNGLRVLAVNPWDVPALRALAAASAKMKVYGAELTYLKAALDASPNDPELDDQLASALARRGEGGGFGDNP